MIEETYTAVVENLKTRYGNNRGWIAKASKDLSINYTQLNNILTRKVPPTKKLLQTLGIVPPKLPDITLNESVAGFSWLQLKLSPAATKDLVYMKSHTANWDADAWFAAEVERLIFTSCAKLKLAEIQAQRAAQKDPDPLS